MSPTDTDDRGRQPRFFRGFFFGGGATDFRALSAISSATSRTTGWFSRRLPSSRSWSLGGRPSDTDGDHMAGVSTGYRHTSEQPLLSVGECR